ncbi:MAG: hypothetical protein Q8L86_06090 [Vicinamibacterales bacterium]|nr:hypothetical protein [Vicinamibacterales bacterium]
MDLGLRTPLLDFFRRGEVARDVRLMAAEGAIAPRPLEQLGLLALLTADHDPDIRETAEATLARIPASLIAAFIARADVPTELRGFFEARGVTPAAEAAPDDATPVADPEPEPDDWIAELAAGVEGAEGERESTVRQLQNMSVPQKVKAAMKGTREMRAVLIRDPNRMVAAAVLSCPKVNESEIESFARMANVTDEILRTIGQTRGWTKSYGVVSALVKNPKTPIAVSLTLLQRLNDRDLKGISIDRNVPEPLRVAARRKVVQGNEKK